MPIQKPSGLQKISRREFGEISYSVMHHAFQIHREMGCFFDECIYRNALRSRLGPDARTELKIGICFEDFSCEYYIDLLLSTGAVFELKCVDSLAGAHRSQLMNYLILCDLWHGKLINFGCPSLEHEFVNANHFTKDRHSFQTKRVDWRLNAFSDWMIAFLHDVGVGLDVSLYEKAAIHHFGGEQKVIQPVKIGGFGFQKFKLAEPAWGLRITTLPQHAISAYLLNIQRLLAQTKLKGFHWVNIGKEEVLFRSVRR